jgi:predicted site-specific integrase-resolvase
MEEYLSGSKASKALGVHQRTLHNWDEKKLIETIRTPGGKRLYNVRKYLQNREKNEDVKKKIINENINELINENFNELINENFNENIKKKIIYARVSSVGQKQDLERQILSLQTDYPNYELIKDIGSGVNLNRKGLRKIIDYAIRGEIEEVIIMHKDRLCRFGYELIEDLIKKYSNGKIIIVNKKEVKEPKEELVEDVLQIMNIFVAKMNGMRKYK